MTRMTPWVRLRRMPADPSVVATLNKAGGALDELWANDEYEVFVSYMGEGDKGLDGPLHLSIKRYDRKPTYDWRELQAIKNDICGAEREAVELFPAESRLVDQANQTHLWVMATDLLFPLGFTERLVHTQAEAVAEAAKIMPTIDIGKGRQREWRPNISTGKDYLP